MLASETSIKPQPDVGEPYFGVLIIRILLFRVLYWGPLFRKLAYSVRERKGECGGFEAGLEG